MRPATLTPTQRRQSYHEWLRASTNGRDPSASNSAPLPTSPSVDTITMGRPSYIRTDSEPVAPRSEQAGPGVARTMSVPRPPAVQRWPSTATSPRAQTPQAQQASQRRSLDIFPSTQRIPHPCLSSPDIGAAFAPMGGAADATPSLSESGRRLMASSSFQAHPRLLSYQRLSQKRLSVIQPVREDVAEVGYAAAPAAYLQLPTVSGGAAQALSSQTMSRAQLRASMRSGVPQ